MGEGFPGFFFFANIFAFSSFRRSLRFHHKGVCGAGDLLSLVQLGKSALCGVSRDENAEILARAVLMGRAEAVEWVGPKRCGADIRRVKRGILFLIVGVYLFDAGFDFLWIVLLFFPFFLCGPEVRQYSSRSG